MNTAAAFLEKHRTFLALARLLVRGVHPPDRFMALFTHPSPASVPGTAPVRPRRTARPLLRPALRLAIPSMAENILQSAVFLVDALMLAAVGELELAAVSMTGIFLWRLTEVIGCLQIGTAAFVARRWGEGRADQARIAATHGVTLAAALGLLTALVVLPFTPWIFRLLSGGEELVGVSVVYTTAILLVFPITQIRINLSASLRAAGDTRTPTLASIVVNLLNVALNYVLIFGKFGLPRLGMAGAGIATALALVIGTGVLLVLAGRGLHPKRLFDEPVVPEVNPAELGIEPSTNPVIPAAQTPPAPPDAAAAPDATFRLVREGFRLRVPGVTGTIFRVSRVSLLEELIVSVGFLTFYRMIATFGTTAMAAHSAVVRLESLSYMIGAGLAVSSSTLVGQSLGRRETATAARAFQLCALLAASLMGTLGIVYAAIPHHLLGWFSMRPGFIELAVPLMIIAAIEQPLIGIAATLGAGLRGAGDTFSPTIAQLVGNLGFRIGFGYLLAFHFGLGIQGIYWATVIDWFLRTLVLTGFILRGRWRSIIV